MKTSPRLLPALVLAAVLGGTCSAQTPADPSLRLDELGTEVARVSRSLEQVSRALDTLVQLQKTNLLMQRLVMEERRISPLASDLRSAKSNLRHQEEELARENAYMEEVADRVSDLAGSGGEAITVFPEYRPHLTFLDVKMAGLDGLDTLTRLR